MEAVKNGWRKSDDPNINIRDKFWSEPHEASKRFQLAEFFARERSRTHPDRVRARNAITALTIAVFPTR
jgi:hypothetical protein